MSYVGATGQTATWSVVSPYVSANGIGDPPSGNYPIEFNMTITGLGAAPWIDPLSVGLPANLGAVVDNSAGVDFTLQWEFVANMGAGFIPLNDVPQGSGGQTQSSFADGFYYLPVPEPGSVALLGVAACVLIGRRRQ